MASLIASQDINSMLNTNNTTLINNPQHDLNANKILLNISSYKDQAVIQSRKLMNSIKTKITKENLIRSLRQDWAYHTKINKEFKIYQIYANKVSKGFLKNRNDISKFCDELKVELRDFIDLMNNYDQHKITLKQDKEIWIKTNDAIIQHKLEEKELNEKQLSKTSNDLISQTMILEQVNQRLNEWKEQETVGFDKWVELEDDEIKRYNEWTIKYQRLKGRYEYYREINDSRYNLNKDQYFKQEEEKEEMKEVDIQWKDKEIKKEYLESIIHEWHQQIEKVKMENHETDLERARIKFLGKAWAGKLKAKQELYMKMQLESKEARSNAWSVGPYKKNAHKAMTAISGPTLFTTSITNIPYKP